MGKLLSVVMYAAFAAIYVAGGYLIYSDYQNEQAKQRLIKLLEENDKLNSV